MALVPLLPRDNNRHSYIIACTAIAVAQCFERISFYGMIGSMEALLSVYPICWVHLNISNMKFLFNGVSFFMAVIFGYIADAYVQRYYVICMGFMLHIAGMTYFVILGHSIDEEYHHNCSSTTEGILPLCYRIDGILYNCTVPIYVFVVMIALGSSAVRTNLATFAADQLRDVGGNTGFRISQFLHLMFWAINVGSFCGYGLLPFFGLKQQFFLTYMLALGSIVAGLVIFAAGFPVYTRITADSSILTTIKTVIDTAMKVKKARKLRGMVKLSFFENAKLENATGEITGLGGDMVDVVKRFCSACFLFLLCIPLGFTFAKMEIWADNHNTPGTIENELKWLFFCQYDNETILISVPIIMFVYHKITKYGVKIHIWVPMVIGMFAALASLLISGVVDGSQPQPHPGAPNSLEVSAFSLYGLSQALFFTAGTEYAYKAAPRASQGTAMGLFFMVMYGTGSFIAIAASDSSYSYATSGFLLFSTITFIVCVKVFKFSSNFTIN